MQAWYEIARRFGRQEEEEADINRSMRGKTEPRTPMWTYRDRGSMATSTTSTTMPSKVSTSSSTPPRPNPRPNPPTNTPAGTTLTSSPMNRTGTFGGAGLPMDLSAMRRMGLCFNCGGRGHLSSSCPSKKIERSATIRALETSREEATSVEKAPMEERKEGGNV